MDTRRMAVGDVELEILEAGAGGRPILVVHGFTNVKEHWSEQAEVLAGSGWHVVVPDLRGHGNSDKPPGEGSYSFRTFAADLVALADRLGWDRFTLLGHSMGGIVAQHIALDHGDRLVALILQDTDHGPLQGIDREAVELGKAVVREGGTKALVEAQRDAGPGPLDTEASKLLEQRRPGWKDFSEGAVLASAADMWIAMVEEMFDHPDRLGALAGLRVPTLVIAGEQDTPFLPGCERIAGAIPGARLVVIPDGGHSPMNEAPEAWRQAVVPFLDEVAERSGVPQP